MTKPATIAVFDVGKTSSKVVLLDAGSLDVIRERKCDNAILNGPPYPHIDVERQWRFLAESLSDFELAHGVDAISITTHGATATIINGADLALPVLDYEFEIPQRFLSAYDELRPDFADTFSPRLPAGLNLGAQLFFQKEQFPEAFGNGSQILMFPQYWCWRLTGEARLEHTSLGTHTDLWNPKERQFSKLVGGAFPPTLFPELAPAHAQFELSETAASQLSLRAGIPVACGIHDSNASLLPWLSLNRPLSVVSSGTWTIAMSMGGNLDNLDQSRDMLANVDANGAPVPTARFMGGREFDLLTTGHSVEFGLTDLAQVISEKTCALPGWVSGVGPFPSGPACWHPAPPKADKTRTAAASIYLAMMTATCLDLVGTGELVVIEGPFARNEGYLQTLAALVAVPVHVSLDATGTSKGAAMLITEQPAPDLGTAVEPAQITGLETYFKEWQALAAR